MKGIFRKLLFREIYGKQNPIFDFTPTVSESDSDNIENLISNMTSAQCEDLESPFHSEEESETNVWKCRTAAAYLFSEYNGVGPFDIVYFKNKINYYPSEDSETISRIKLNRTGDFFNFLDIYCPAANIQRLQFGYEHPYVELGPIEFPPLNTFLLTNIFVPAPVNGHIYSVLTITWDKPIQRGTNVELIINFGITRNYDLRTRTVVGPIAFNFLEHRYFFSHPEVRAPNFQITEL